MVQRQDYLQQLLAWKDEQIIKVVTGIRRCGKSTLLAQYQELLLEQGVEPRQIVSVNFEDLDFEELLDYQKLHTYLKERLVPKKRTYIFLDEIQRVAGFEKVVDSLYLRPNVDLYISGSNAYMLSGDLATLLTGRYVEIKMLPLSFREFAELTGQPSDEGFAEYLQVGGLPYVAVMERTPEGLKSYFEGSYNTALVEALAACQSRKERDPNKRKITDIVLLKNIAKFLASVVGSPVSVKGVTDFLISSGRKVSPNTVDDYIEALCEAFIFYPAERLEISGKELLKSNRKFYMVDLGLRNFILPKRRYDLGFSLENVVFFELLRRGCQVHVGKIGDCEVDFVARKEDAIVYYQVTADLSAEATFERELRPLRAITDNYEKVVLTLDRFTAGNYEGIKVLPLVDWLLEG